jgi:hypothetical protein
MYYSSEKINLRKRVARCSADFKNTRDGKRKKKLIYSEWADAGKT